MELTEPKVNKTQNTIQRLADETKSAIAVTLVYNMKTAKDLDARKRWLTRFYAEAFQLISFIDMAVKTKVSDEDFMNELDKLFTETK